MKLVTFQGASRGDRIGALTAEGWIVDLNAAYASYLRNVEREGAFYALADARVPSDMRALFENGDRGLDAAQTALEYATKGGPETKGVSGEPIFSRRETVSIKAPIVPRKFFHTAGNFREHHEDAQKAGFSHPILPWIVFFQNVDAIIGPDAPIIYPEHLTEELDYELELAVVLKKGGKHFSAEQAREYIGGCLVLNELAGRDIHGRGEQSGRVLSCPCGAAFWSLGPYL